ncbi:MAG TPA: Gfo/Idh/MocA family oxidoreductase [Streptosporangiaceae bacterium]|jgi:predicted dehydrogenase
MTESLGVGMVGYAFMGAAHSQAWRTAPHAFDLPLRPVLAALCGRDPEATAAAARRYGFDAAETDWHALLEREDVQLIDICTPGDSHAEIAVAALDAGKHVLCEKPLANTVAEAEAMAAAAGRAQARGIRSMIGFNYRRVPALALARELIASGRAGEIRHVRASYLQDWLADPAFPLTWRLQREHAGSGALGDLGAHIVDLAQFLTGQLIAGVSGVATTFVPKRPIPGGSGATGPVTVDDAVAFTGRLESGGLASFEATRFAAGRKNALRIEVNGSRGSLAFDLERLNELEFCDAVDDPATAGFRRILVTEPGHPYLSAWWPPGHVLGWEHTFTHQVRDLVTAIGQGTDPEPSFADGLQVQHVLAAVAASAAQDSRWTPV